MSHLWYLVMDEEHHELMLAVKELYCHLALTKNYMVACILKYLIQREQKAQLMLILK